MAYIFTLFGDVGDGGVASWIVGNVFQPVGDIFLQSLWMIIIPLVFSSLTLGVTNLGNTKTLQQMGVRVLLFYITTTVCCHFNWSNVNQHSSTRSGN